MGDKIVQLIFEKIKTPAVKKVDSLEGTGRGVQGFGSIGVQSTDYPAEYPEEYKSINDRDSSINVSAQHK